MSSQLGLVSLNKAFAPATFCSLAIPVETWEDIQQTIELVRNTRPDDIGISFSYPLPGTVFYERVQEQIGAKRNWTDSDDLCVMFCAAYQDEFYRALRDALHAEVDSWKNNDVSEQKHNLASLWQRVYDLEPTTRNLEATTLPLEETREGRNNQKFVPLQTLTPAARQI